VCLLPRVTVRTKDASRRAAPDAREGIQERIPTAPFDTSLAQFQIDIGDLDIIQPRKGWRYVRIAVFCFN